MPRYILTRSTANPTNGGCCCDNSIDRNSALFFSNLAAKLIDLTKAFEAKIDEIKKNCGSTSQARGFILAQIDAKPPTIGVKREYLEYIKRYGPPMDGVFDETLLQQLRDELGISATANTI